MTTSLRKGLGLIDILAAVERPLGLTDLSRRAGLPKSTVHRLLTSLTATGFVTQETDGRYALGLRLFELGSRVAARLDIRQIARPQLRRLRDMTGETAHLGVVLDDSVVYLEKVDSGQKVQMSSRLGGRNPLHSTALGKALLAFGSQELRERILAGPLPARTPRTLVDPDRLAEELDRVRRRGWALDDEESDPQVRCVAAPVIDATGFAVAAISVSGPSSRVTKRTVRPLAEHVMRTAAAVSRSLGGLPAREPMVSG